MKKLEELEFNDVALEKVNSFFKSGDILESNKFHFDENGDLWFELQGGGHIFTPRNWLKFDYLTLKDACLLKTGDICKLKLCDIKPGSPIFGDIISVKRQGVVYGCGLRDVLIKFDQEDSLNHYRLHVQTDKIPFHKGDKVLCELSDLNRPLSICNVEKI